MTDGYKRQIDNGKKWVEETVREMAQAEGIILEGRFEWREVSDYLIHRLIITYKGLRYNEAFSEGSLADCNPGDNYPASREVRDRLASQIGCIFKTLRRDVLPYERYLTASEREGVRLFVKRVRARFGDKILKCCIFGSKVRGDYKPDSDIDILLVVDSDDWRIRDEISDIAAVIDAVDIAYGPGSGLSPVVYGKNEYKKNEDFRTFFVQEVEREGMPLG
ncbi:MAG: nucleotidyltransferase domain-containing protein [Deltaproteobacteria bacterium]|nr:nucleotidyltransferase domain-containing protein [Deltaproteobacteria bacterium]